MSEENLEKSRDGYNSILFRISENKEKKEFVFENWEVASPNKGECIRVKKYAIIRESYEKAQDMIYYYIENFEKVPYIFFSGYYFKSGENYRFTIKKSRYNVEFLEISVRNTYIDLYDVDIENFRSVSTF